MKVDGRTLMGAWIETAWSSSEYESHLSHPIRVRGLKRTETQSGGILAGRTLMGAWIET